MALLIKSQIQGTTPNEMDPFHFSDLRMIKVKHMVVLACLLVMLPFCGKNPAGPLADEERILFIRSSGRGSGYISEICTMKPDGSEIQVIAHYEKGDDYYSEGYDAARWSQDKTMLVIEGGPGSTKEYNALWLMDNEGNLLKKIAWNGHDPYWTSNGQFIIHTRRRGYFSESWDIYRLSISSLKEDTLLFAETGPPGSNSGNRYRLFGIWPKNESCLILSESYTYQDSLGRQTDDDTEIIIFNYLTKNKEYLTDNNLEDAWPKVSPDGRYIAFLRKNPQTYRYTNNIYVMNIDGDSINQLTTGTKDVYLHLIWSPDGENLAFDRADQSEHYNPYGDVFILDVSTGEVSQLTNTAQDSIMIKIMEWR